MNTLHQLEILNPARDQVASCILIPLVMAMGLLPATFATWPLFDLRRFHAVILDEAAGGS